MLALVSSVLTACVFEAHSLTLQTAPFQTNITISENVDDMICDAAAMAKARLAFKETRFEDVKGNPCVHEDFLTGIELGSEDPEDHSEFLGRDSIAQDGATLMLPKILYIGLPHAGSTSLAYQMNAHPQLSYGITKEHRTLDLLTGSGSAEIGALRTRYENQFPVDENITYTFDATPHTMFLGLDDDQWYVDKSPIGLKVGTGAVAVQAIKAILGDDIKFIFMGRDPLDWQVSMTPGHPHSMFQMLTLNEVLGHRSCYADALETWLQEFPAQNFLFLESSDFFADTQKTLDQVTDFIGVDRFVPTSEQSEPQGRRRLNRQATPAMRQEYWADDRQVDCLNRLNDITSRTHTPIRFDWGP